MKAVNIAELKNRLSHYLHLVRRGESLLVRDRDRTVARIDPVPDPSRLETDEERRIADLAARGVVRLPEQRPSAAFWRDLDARRPKIEADVLGALLGEREDGR